MMPGYTMPPIWIVILFPSTSFFPSHSFFSPLPAHFASLLPYSWATFHTIFSSILMQGPKWKLVFNNLGKWIHKFKKCCFLDWFRWFNPSIFTSITIPSNGNPLLFSIFWIFMLIKSNEFLITFWTRFLK